MKSSVLLSAIAAVVCLPAVLLANTINMPTQIFYKVNYVSVGLGGVKGTGVSPGVAPITLAGVSGTISKALLFWHGPTYSTDPTVNANILFDGHPITGQNIGFSSDNCWGYLNSQAYRADVTGWVTGNGIYTVGNYENALALCNGFSLIVFFDDGNPSDKRDVVLYQGNDSNIPNPYDAPGWNVVLPDIDYSILTPGAAYLQVDVSDGQIWPDGPLYLNGLVLDSGGPSQNVFTGFSVPNAYAESVDIYNGGLWDIHTYDVTSWLVAEEPPPESLTMTIDLGSSDCLSLIVALIDLPHGASPPTAFVTPVYNSAATTTQYYELTATDSVNPPSALKLYVTDSSTPSFLAGPYCSGSELQFKNGATAGVTAGRGLVKAVITTVGTADVYAVNTSSIDSEPVAVP